MDEGFNTTSAKHGRHKTGGSMAVTVAAVAIALGVGFIGGMHYQTGSGSTATGNGLQATMQGGQMGGPGGQQMGTFGTVTAISDSSITVQQTEPGGMAGSGAANSNNATDTSTTLSITSNTKVTNNGSTASVSDIKTGDTVMIQASSSDSKQAASIAVNPSLPSAGGGNGGPGAQAV